MKPHPNVRSDLAGRKFGRLTAKYCVGVAGDNSGAVWRCECECGTWVKIRRRSLISGDTKSCGCLRRDFDRWQSAEGFSRIVSDLGERVEAHAADDYEAARRLTTVLTNKYGAAMIGRAIRDISRQSRGR